MGIFDSLFGKKRKPSEDMVVKLIETGRMCHFMNNSTPDQKGANFESALISAFFLLKFAKAHGRGYELVEKYTFSYLMELSRKYNISSRLNMNLSDFMNLRFEQYTIELEGMIKHEGQMLPSNTLFNLYDTPLQPKSGDCMDLFFHMNFVKEFMRFIDIAKKSSSLIIETARMEHLM